MGQSERKPCDERIWGIVMKKWLVLGAVCLALITGSSVTMARDYDAELRKCLVQSASSYDAVILALWSGLAMTQHTAITSMVAMPETEFVKITEEAGNIYLRLAGEMCLNETFNALKYIGSNALNSGLDYLVAVRASDNYSDLGTRKAIALFNAYTEDKLYATLLNAIGTSIDKPKDDEKNYEYELKKCLIQSASVRDKALLALWSGLIMTQHTDVAPMNVISENEFLKITEEAGKVYLRLTCEMCLEETFNVVKYGNDNALGNCFSWLEEVSKPEVDSNIGVQNALHLFDNYTSNNLFKLLKKHAENKDVTN